MANRSLFLPGLRPAGSKSNIYYINIIYLKTRTQAPGEKFYLTNRSRTYTTTIVLTATITPDDRRGFIPVFSRNAGYTAFPPIDGGLGWRPAARSTLEPAQPVPQ